MAALVDWSEIRSLTAESIRDTFGATVTYTPQGGVAASITAIFRAAHQLVEVQGGEPITTVAPILKVVLADLAATPRQNDTVAVSGATYKVGDVRPDGNGIALLVLRRVS